MKMILHCIIFRSLWFLARKFLRKELVFLNLRRDMRRVRFLQLLNNQKKRKNFRQKSSMEISQLDRELINQRKKLSQQLLILQDSRPRKHQKRNQIFLNELLKNIILHSLRKGVKRNLRISQLHQRYIRKLQLQQTL